MPGFGSPLTSLDDWTPRPEQNSFINKALKPGESHEVVALSAQHRTTGECIPAVVVRLTSREGGIDAEKVAVHPLFTPWLSYVGNVTPVDVTGRFPSLSGAHFRTRAAIMHFGDACWDESSAALGTSPDAPATMTAAGFMHGLEFARTYPQLADAIIAVQNELLAATTPKGVPTVEESAAATLEALREGGLPADEELLTAAKGKTD